MGKHNLNPMQKHLLIFAAILFWSYQILGQISISAESLSKHVYFLANDSLEGRSPGTKGCVAASNYIVDEFQHIGIQPLVPDYFQLFTFRNGINSIEAKNILGIIEGDDPNLKNEFIIIGAHYDHIGYYFKTNSSGEKVIFNGADDNASGVASLIEIGRQLKKLKLKRSVILAAWDAEESGLLGSYQFIRDSILNPSQIKLAISIDMVGMLQKANGLSLLGLGTLIYSESELEQLSQLHKIKIKTTSNRVPLRTDTRPFGELGISAIQITTGTVSPYHKPEDDANLLDYSGMVQITEFLTDFIVYQANSANELLSTIKPKNISGKPHLFKLGLRANMGSNHHDYTDMYFQSKSDFAFGLGLYSQLRLQKWLTFQPEISYENKTTSHLLGQFTTHAVTYDMNLLFCTTADPTEQTRAYFLLGAYYSQIFKGTIDFKTENYTDNFTTEENGINWGLGMDVYFMQIGFTQKIGLSSLIKNWAGPDFTSVSSYFTIGYTF